MVKGEATTAQGDEIAGEGRIPLPPTTKKPLTAVLVVEDRSTKRQAVRDILILGLSVWKTRRGCMGEWVSWGFGKFWGFMGFRGEMRDTIKTNVVVQTTSDEEGEAALIIADVGSH